MLCLVSTQFYDIIFNATAMTNHRVVPLLQISPSKNAASYRRLIRTVEQLHHHRDKLQHYRKVQIIDGHKFQSYDVEKIENITETLQLNGVVSLDMSSPILEWSSISFYEALARILPNLREIDLSNTECQPSSAIRAFSRECPRLEKITWNSTNKPLSSANIDGDDVTEATNLKEMYIDNAVFKTGYINNIRGLSDLENDGHSHIYLFHKCGSKVLERISIKNARYSEFLRSEIVPFPQNALIKFIRHAPPSLRWFRSDLTQENIGMLRSERPTIEFVN